MPSYTGRCPGTLRATPGEPTVMLLSATGKPFSDRDAAAVKAARVSQELGEQYVVVEIYGGYAVTSRADVALSDDDVQPKSQVSTGENVELSVDPPQAETSKPDTAPFVNTRLRAPIPPLSSTNNKENNDQVLTLRPALRSFLLQQFLFICGLLIAIGATPLTGAVLDSNDVLVGLVSPMFLHELFVLVGASLAVITSSKISYSYISNRYVIGPEYIESSEGIVARKTKRIDYLHIRQVNVTQSVLERLLNTGSVEISSAATEGGDIEFRDVGNPVLVQGQIASRRYGYPKSRGAYDD